jgi:thioesterase domain-containing protein
MIHPLGGEVLCYRNLAIHLGLDQPMYGLRPQGIDGKQPFLLRVEDMAAKYLQEMQTLQPQGPYFLGGYSFGGIIAYEIAQQIRSQGQKVALLAMLDTCRPGYQRRLSFKRRILLHINNIFQRGPKYIAHKVKGWCKQVYYNTKQFCNHYFLARSHVIVPEDKKYLEISNAHKQALNTYVFRPYSGKLTLFRTRDENRTEAIGLEYDSQFGWGEIVTDDLDVKYIPGSHLSLLNEPNVRVLAKQVKICLEKAQSLE